MNNSNHQGKSTAGEFEEFAKAANHLYINAVECIDFYVQLVLSAKETKWPFSDGEDDGIDFLEGEVHFLPTLQEMYVNWKEKIDSMYAIISRLHPILVLAAKSPVILDDLVADHAHEAAFLLARRALSLISHTASGFDYGESLGGYYEFGPVSLIAETAKIPTAINKIRVCIIKLLTTKQKELLRIRSLIEHEYQQSLKDYWTHFNNTEHKGGHRKVLSENEQIVYEYLVSNPFSLAKTIAAGTGIPKSSIERHVIPELKRHHLIDNKKGRGYYAFEFLKKAD